ncbi:hypothetical protein TWF481_006925 [Arthrobotrys musiformis]|uniref:Uncharacterized protein n=1 Tax=Arthrobotrys musiformis TaxID=47236 RepID=A0AAV9WFN2_9PEZI
MSCQSYAPEGDDADGDSHQPRPRITDADVEATVIPRQNRINDLSENFEDMISCQPPDLFPPFGDGDSYTTQPLVIPFKPIFRFRPEDQALLLRPGSRTEILQQYNTVLPKDILSRSFASLNSVLGIQSEEEILLDSFQNAVVMLAISFSEPSRLDPPSAGVINSHMSVASGILIDDDKVLTRRGVALARGEFPGSVPASVMAWNNNEDITLALRKSPMAQIEDIAVLKLASPLVGGRPVAPVPRKREWIEDGNPVQHQITVLSFNTELKSSDVKSYYLEPLEDEDLDRGLKALAGGRLSAASSTDWCYGTEFNTQNTIPTPHIHRKLVRQGCRDTIGYRVSCTGGSGGGLVMVGGDFVGMHQGGIYDAYAGPRGNELKIANDSLSRAIPLDLPEVNTFMRTKVLHHFNNEELKGLWEECLVDLEADAGCP